MADRRFALLGHEHEDYALTEHTHIGTWIVPTLLNSWVNYGVGYSEVGYLKDVNGFVHLRGLLKSGTSALATFFVLPVGYRPPLREVHSVMSNDVITRLDILANGIVTLISGGSTAYVSLDGVSFFAG